MMSFVDVAMIVRIATDASDTNNIVVSRVEIFLMNKTRGWN